MEFEADDAVTVMFAVPAETAVTTPVALTVATAVLLLTYAIVNAGAPAGCTTEAVNPWVRPTDMASDAGCTLSDVMPDGNAPTVIVAEAVRLAGEKPVPAPAAVAVIVATPGATAVTTTEPLAPTAPMVAIAVLDVVYV